MFFAKNLTGRQLSVYYLLSFSDGHTHKEIVQRLGMPPRTVRHAISFLRRAKLVVAYQGDYDIRAPIYALARRKGAV